MALVVNSTPPSEVHGMFNAFENMYIYIQREREREKYVHVRSDSKCCYNNGWNSHASDNSICIYNPTMIYVYIYVYIPGDTYVFMKSYTHPHMHIL